ncbi:hypothetical protein DENIS_2606 [Desulfonema ishimotonii]|uniref:Uncharacterized protein n=1 Tax=Desulfonema ishimotonii TaxID=45657 RepID=A0A401FXH7_9BACT|nr:hypothetical protein [Desulfonema ishimotonii]GBC61644.1 hypothetical protein DENIS_2606 [Desulfonema ishimotonii]
MKDKIYYTNKFRALVVVISDEELANIANLECEKHNQPGLLNNQICHVFYEPPEKETSTKQKNYFLLGYILLVIFWVVCLALMILGVIKFTEILSKWMA